MYEGVVEDAVHEMRHAARGEDVEGVEAASAEDRGEGVCAGVDWIVGGGAWLGCWPARCCDDGR